MSIAEKCLTSQHETLDHPWKHALDRYFVDFMQYFLPDIAQQLDWAKGYECLDKELLAITGDTQIGRRIGDKLLKVWEKISGKPVLCHLELQGKAQTVFAERMLVYRYRIRDRYQLPIISIALLLDDSPNWRPAYYQESCYGSSLELHYLVIKLTDYRARRQELEAITKPFAMIILAQLVLLETRKKPQARLQAKTALTRLLYTKGWDKEQMMAVYNLIDWLIALPEELVINYHQNVQHIEEEFHVNYMNTATRIGFEEGLQKGKLEGQLEGKIEGFHEGEITLLQRQLNRRFGIIPADYLERMQQADNDTLLSWSEQLLDANTLDEVFK